jgi:hypothetical protein
MTDHTHPRPAAGSPVDCDVGRLEPERDSSGPRGTYGCACRSRDARECMARRYPDLTLGPQPDDMDEYRYLSAERCQCMCHDWSDEDDNLG